MNRIFPSQAASHVARAVSAATVSVAMSWSSVALAQNSQTDNGTESQWSLGVGAANIQKIYRNIGSYNRVVPIVGYESKWVSLVGSKLDMKLYSVQSMSFRLRARYSGSDGYKGSDSPYLTGMDERKGGFWAGGALDWKNDIANVSAELLGDAAGNSKGSQLKLELNRRFSVGSLGFTPRVGVEWNDRKFVDYYYGVKESEARVGRNAYQGRSSESFEGGLRVDYSPARQHMVFLNIGATQFGNGIKDSPLVQKSSQSIMVLGYIYRF